MTLLTRGRHTVYEQTYPISQVTSEPLGSSCVPATTAQPCITIEIYSIMTQVHLQHLFYKKRSSCGGAVIPSLRPRRHKVGGAGTCP